MIGLRKINKKLSKNDWCEVCCIRLAEEKHHIKSRVEKGSDEDSNIAYLCRPCHLLEPGYKNYNDYKKNGGLYWMGFKTALAMLYDFKLFPFQANNAKEFEQQYSLMKDVTIDKFRRKYNEN